MLNEIISIIRTQINDKKTFTKQDIYNAYKSNHKYAKSYELYKKLITSAIEEIILGYDYKKQYLNKADQITVVYKPTCQTKPKHYELSVDMQGRIYISKKLSKYLNVVANEMVQKIKLNDSIIITSDFTNNANASYIGVGKNNGFHVSIGKHNAILSSVHVDAYKNKLEIKLI
jgi:hypothetical protein